MNGVGLIGRLGRPGWLVLCWFVWISSPVHGQNLLTDEEHDPSFEGTDQDGRTNRWYYTVVSGTIYGDSSGSSCGDRHFKWDSTTSTPSGRQMWIINLVPVSPNTTYTASVQWKTTSAAYERGRMRLVHLWYDADQVRIASNVGPTNRLSSSGNWEEKRSAATAPATAAFARLRIDAWHSNSSVIARFDCAKFYAHPQARATVTFAPSNTTVGFLVSSMTLSLRLTGADTFTRVTVSNHPAIDYGSPAVAAVLTNGVPVPASSWSLIGRRLLVSNITFSSSRRLAVVYTPLRPRKSGPMAFKVHAGPSGVGPLLAQAVWKVGLNIGDIRFSEISWGNRPNASYQWIELCNVSPWTLNLKGCFMNDGAGGGYTLKGAKDIPPRSYYLLEASESATAIPADELYGLTALSFNQGGDLLFLRDIRNVTVETMNFMSGWPAGTNWGGDTDNNGYSTNVSMERIDLLEPASAAWNWKHGPGFGPLSETNDGGQGKVAGTPRHPNTGTRARLGVSISAGAASLNGLPSAPIPGASIPLIAACSNIGLIRATNVLLDVVLPSSMSYVTQTVWPGAEPRWSTNASPDRSWNSAHFQTVRPPKSRIRWIRLRIPEIRVNEGGSVDITAVIR